MKKIIYVIISVALIIPYSCKKDDQPSTDGNRSTTEKDTITFFAPIAIDSTLSIHVNGVAFYHDKIIAVGWLDNNDDRLTFLWVINSEGELEISRTYNEFASLRSPDFLHDGGFVAQEDNYQNGSPVHIFDETGTRKHTISVRDTIDDMANYSDIRVNGVLVNIDNEIIAYGQAYTPQIRRVYGQLLKFDVTGNLIKTATSWNGILSASRMSYDQLALLTYSDDPFDREIRFYNNNFNPLGNRLLNIDVFERVEIYAREDITGLYINNHRFDNGGGLLYSIYLPSAFPVDYSATVGNDGGLLVGSGIYNENGQFSFYLEKFNIGDGTQEWVNHVKEAPPHKILYAHQLSNGVILGLALIVNENSNDEIGVFKVDHLGEFEK